MTIFIMIARILLFYWIIATVVRFIRRPRESRPQDTPFRDAGPGANRPVVHDVPTGDIVDADFEEIKDK